MSILFMWGMSLIDQTHAQSKDEIKQEIVDSANRNGVDPNLALAIAEVESQFNKDAVGGLGELGVFQLRPEYHAVIPGATAYNIDLGTRYIARLQHDCQEYGDAFFVCFNYGTARKLKYPRKFPYYQRVMIALQRQQLP